MHFDKRWLPILQNKLPKRRLDFKGSGKSLTSFTKYIINKIIITLYGILMHSFIFNQWNHSRGMSNDLMLVQNGTKHIKLKKPIYQTSLHVLKVYNRQENWKLFLTFIWRGLFNFKVLGNIGAEAASSGTLALSKEPKT